MWSIERRHFQWPWTTPNPVFKVMLFFDAEYLINGKRYGHSYYERRIGTRTQAFECYQFQWPPMTFSRSRLFNINLKIVKHSYTYNGRPIEIRIMIYRTAPFSMTWTTPTPCFKVGTFFVAEYLKNTTYRHSFNEILIGIYTRPTQQCHFNWSWVT